MKEIYCPKCQTTYAQGSFCTKDGSKLLTRVTTNIEFKPIDSTRNADQLKKDAKQWLERIGVAEIVFSSLNNAAIVSYVLQGKKYEFKSHLQNTLTNNYAAIEQFLHHRVLGIERGIESTEQAFAGYVQLEQQSKDYFAGCQTLADADSKYRELSKMLHPDRNNGHNDAFVEMKRQYEEFCRGLQ